MPGLVRKTPGWRYASYWTFRSRWPSTVVCLDEFQDLLVADDALDGPLRSVIQHHGEAARPLEAIERALSETRDTHQAVWDALSRVERIVCVALADADSKSRVIIATGQQANSHCRVRQHAAVHATPTGHDRDRPDRMGTSRK